MPLPFLLMFRVYVFSVKVAVTDLAALIVTMQVPVPVQSPLQPEKDEPMLAASLAAVQKSVACAP